MFFFLNISYRYRRSKSWPYYVTFNQSLSFIAPQIEINIFSSLYLVHNRKLIIYEIKIEEVRSLSTPKEGQPLFIDINENFKKSFCLLFFKTFCTVKTHHDP